MQTLERLGVQLSGGPLAQHAQDWRVYPSTSPLPQ